LITYLHVFVGERKELNTVDHNTYNA